MMEKALTIDRSDLDLAKVALQFTVGELDHDRIHEPQKREAELQDFRLKYTEAVFRKGNNAAGFFNVTSFLRWVGGFAAEPGKVITDYAAGQFSKGLDHRTELLRHDLQLIKEAIDSGEESLSLPITLSSIDLPEYLHEAADAVVIKDERSREFAEELRAFATALADQRDAAVME